MVLEFSGEDLVHKRLLQRFIRDMLPLVDAGEALGFLRECIQLHLREYRSNSFNPHPPLFLSEPKTESAQHPHPAHVDPHHIHCAIPRNE